MKIGREDFEAFIKGEKSIAPYIEMDPLAGSYSVFGVKTASNPNYLVKAIYEMYEANLDKKLAVQAVRKLFHSVGKGSVGLNNLLKKVGMDLTRLNFLCWYSNSSTSRDGVLPSNSLNPAIPGSCFAPNTHSNLKFLKTGRCRSVVSTEDGLRVS